MVFLFDYASKVLISFVWWGSCDPIKPPNEREKITNDRNACSVKISMPELQMLNNEKMSYVQLRIDKFMCL